MQRKQIKQYISSPLNYQGGKARILGLRCGSPWIAHQTC